MAEGNQIGAIERAEEETVEKSQDTLPRNPIQEFPPPSRENVKSIFEDGTQNEASQTAESDLEQLAPVTTGPVYSAFSVWKKRYIVLMVTWAAFLSPTSANIYFPALNSLQADLDVDTKLINLTLTSYMIFQGLAPTFFGDLADMAGRRPAYILAFVIYMGANIGLALQDSYAALFILRCLQSTGSSGAIALGYGVVADISSSSERGTYMGIVGAGTMMGPAIGPVIGGLLAQFLGWRSIFWFLTILSGCFLVPFILTVPETGRNIVGNGSIPPKGWNMTILEYFHQHHASKSTTNLSLTPSLEILHLQQAELAKNRHIRFPNPLKTIHIILEKDMAIILLSNSLIYVAFYDILATIPELFQEIYHFNDLQIGLCYLPFGVGCAISSFANGKMLDRNYKRVARQIGFTIDRKRGDDLRNFPIEKARLDLIWPLLVFGLMCILCYGWVLEKEVNLAAPLILQFLIGLTVNGSFNILSTLVVDLYPQSPSTATAANNLVRCLMGAGGMGVISLMVKGMGRGWCFTFVAAVCGVCMPMLWVELKWGQEWREERRIRLEREEKEVILTEARDVESEGGSLASEITGTPGRDVEKV